MAYKLRIETNNPLLAEPEECSICLKDMWTQVTLSCGHKYHFNCINTWFGYQKNCPYCRHPFSPPASPAGVPPPPPPASPAGVPPPPSYPPPPSHPPPPSYPSPPSHPPSSHPPPSPTFSDVSSETYESTLSSTQCAGCFALVRRLRRRRHQLQLTA